MIYLLFGIILIVHALLLTKLIFFPYPELFIYPYLTNHGLKPYQQILDQHFPGLLFFPINFNNLGMISPEIARIWLIVIVLITHLFLFFISRQILKSDKKAILVNLLYLVWQPFFEGWVLWIDSFLPLILLPAFYFLYMGDKENWGDKWVFGIGVFLGLGVVFKQVLVPLIVLVLVYLLWRSKKLKTALLFLMGLIGPVGGMLVYLTSIGVINDFWYWTVVFNLTIYAQMGKKFAPTLAHMTRVAFVFGLASLALLSKDRKTIQILFIFLIGSLAGVFTRFDFVHFQPALPFAILATVYGLGRLKKLGRLLWVGYLLVSVWWLNIFYRGHLGNKILFFDAQTYELAATVRQYTEPHEKIFVFGMAPHLYQMTDTLPAGDIFVFQFPWFLRISEDRILEGLKKDQPRIVVANREAEIENLKIKDYAVKLDQYILKNYQKVDEVEEASILLRKGL